MSNEIRREEIELVLVDSLLPYEKNAKKHTNEQIDAVESSIKEFGFRNPVIAWHDDNGDAVIVAGHARCEAAKNIGMKRVPVIFADDLSDAQRRALTLADNQTTMMTGWDFDLLSQELDDICEDIDMSDFGFDVGGAIDWDSVPELSDESYEEPEHEMLKCPKCGHIDRRDRFKSE